MKRSRKLAIIVTALLLVSLLAPVKTEAATTNSIKQVGIKNLPEDSTITISTEDYSYDFNKAILARETKGKKVTDVVYWEVRNAGTTGVVSSYSGKVYPVTAGSFETRVIAFKNTADRAAWLAAKKADKNTDVADYATAWSEWATINVETATEGLAIVHTERGLNIALKNRDCTDIHVITNSERNFAISAYNYTRRTLTIDAPNADVTNSARFAKINIEQIKASTFFENAIGNKFFVTAPNASINVGENGRISEVEVAPESQDSNINLTSNGGGINNVKVSTPANVTVSGTTKGDVSVVVEEAAKGTTIATQVNLNLTINADTTIQSLVETLQNIINIIKTATVEINGTAAETTVNVSENAEGSKVITDTTVTVEAGANVEVELKEGAEGSSVVKTNDEVDVTVDNHTKEDVEVKDSEGNVVETVGPEEVSEITGTPTEAVTPAPTTEPTTPVNPGTPSTPNPTATPAPTSTPEPSGTPDPTDTVSYTVTYDSDKEKTVSFAEGSTTATIVIPIAGDITIAQDGTEGTSQTAKVVVGTVNSIRIDGTDYTIYVVVPGNETIAVSAKVASKASETVSGSAELSINVNEIETKYSDADANVTPRVTYQWYTSDDNAAINGETSSTYKVSIGTEITDANTLTSKYHVVVTFTYAEGEFFTVSSKK